MWYGARSDVIARKLVDAARAKKFVERSGGLIMIQTAAVVIDKPDEAWRRNETRLRQCRLGTDARRRRGGRGGGREGGKDEGVRLLVVQVQVVQAQAVGCGAGASKTSSQGSRLSDGQRQERGLDANPAPFARFARFAGVASTTDTAGSLRMPVRMSLRVRSLRLSEQHIANSKVHHTADLAANARSCPLCSAAGMLLLRKTAEGQPASSLCYWLAGCRG